MKELYTIGETAKLLGVSTQTLRYYDREDILKPVFTDEATGYRYYSYKQFHVVDRIKYLQGFGLSLEEIEPVIKDGSVEKLLPALNGRKEALLEEISSAVDKIRDIDWYINYFTYTGGGNEDFFYHIHEPARYILEVPCYPEDELSDMEIRLAERKNTELYRHLSYRRQYGYKLKLDDLKEGQFKPDTYFIYTKAKPAAGLPDIKVIPEGDYVCFRTPILKEDWDKELMQTFFVGRKTEGLVLALEFEDNLVDWSDAMYEVQVLL